MRSNPESDNLLVFGKWAHEELDDNSKTLLLPQYRNISKDFSVSDIIEEPVLHTTYNGPSDFENLREKLIHTSIAEFEETNALGETLLMKAIRHDDEPTAAKGANVQTLGLLSSVRWITTDVEAYINSPDIYGSTPYWRIDFRRRDNEMWARIHERQPDKDPEQVYQAFMELVQKTVDDHYGFDAHGDQEGEDPRRRMVAVPRNDNSKYLDIVEESIIEEVFESDIETSDTEGSSDEEEWDDASDEDEWDDAREYREEPAESVTGN
ncbi:MAG: hypothetical protein Q9182_003353 [Xanthomendoza sp. 2 TL-2023]